jgi:hypothetical protein
MTLDARGGLPNVNYTALLSAFSLAESVEELIIVGRGRLIDGRLASRTLFRLAGALVTAD